MQIKEKIKEICIKQLDRSYEKRLRRIKPDYHEWVTEKESKEMPKPFSAEEPFVVLYQSRGKLAEGALVYLAEGFRRMDKAQILYGDEDMLMKDGRITAEINMKKATREEVQAALGLIYGEIAVLEYAGRYIMTKRAQEG